MTQWNCTSPLFPLPIAAQRGEGEPLPQPVYVANAQSSFDHRHPGCVIGVVAVQLLSPLQGWFYFCVRNPGLHPGLSSAGLSALQFGFASQLRLGGSLAPPDWVLFVCMGVHSWLKFLF
jgi:hypothetical protein